MFTRRAVASSSSAVDPDPAVVPCSRTIERGQDLPAGVLAGERGCGGGHGKPRLRGAWVEAIRKEDEQASNPPRSDSLAAMV